MYKQDDNKSAIMSGHDDIVMAFEQLKIYRYDWNDFHSD